MSTESLPSDTDADGGHMTLVEHLTELRKRLIIAVSAVGVGMLVVFAFYDPIFDFLIQPYEDIANTNSNVLGEGQLLQVDPLEGFGVRMRIAGEGMRTAPNSSCTRWRNGRRRMPKW